MPNDVDEQFVNDVFSYHAPTADQIPKYEAIRYAGRVFARVLFENVDPCADRTAAIRKVREAVMTANAAIALNARV